MGWMLLGERPGRELTFGQVGRPWKPTGGLPSDPVTRAQFAAFDQPGFAKLVESTRVDPYGERSSIVITETRVRCTDQDSRRRFWRYWLVVGPCSHLLRKMSLRMWVRKLEGAG
jgi:molybdopterin biosynthesis enzyme